MFNIIQSSMKKIIFATTNPGKVAALANRLPKDKYEIVPMKLELPEPQANSSHEISEVKARAAFEQIRQPLVVQDSSFHIAALNGFPGPYIKYVQETIGPEGILKLMDGVEDRSCYFELALTYIDENGTKTFVKKGTPGKLAFEVYTTHSEKAWGYIWKVYIPHWADKPLSAMTKEEIDAREKKKDDDSEFGMFAKWLIEQEVQK